jgi:hypothetical protein
MVGFNAGYYGETGNPLNPQLSNKADHQVNLNQEANWDSSYAYGQNTTSTPSYQFYNAYAKIFQLYSNAYGFGYSDALEADSNPSPLLPVYDESSASPANVATVNLTVFSPTTDSATTPNADPSQTGFTSSAVCNYIAAPAVQNNLYALPTDSAAGDNIVLSFQNPVAGTYQAFDIARTDKVTLKILTGYDGETPKFESVSMDGASAAAGAYGLWQQWDISGTAGNFVATPNAAAGYKPTGTMMISDIPVSDPPAPAPAPSELVSWYQIIVANENGNASKTYNLYTTTAASGGVTQFLNTSFPGQSRALQIDGGASIASPLPATPTSSSFNVNYNTSYGPTLAVREGDGAALPPNIQYSNTPTDEADLDNQVQYFNSQSVAGIYVLNLSPTSTKPAIVEVPITGQLTISNPNSGVNLFIYDEPLVDATTTNRGSLWIDMAGTLTLSTTMSYGGNTYSGGTTVQSGTLEIQSGGSPGNGKTWIDAGATEIIRDGGSAGSKPIIFVGVGGGATLEIDAPAGDATTFPDGTFTNTLSGFGVGDILDLAGMPAGFVSTAAVANNVLTVTSGQYTESFNLDASSPYATSFTVTQDGQGGLKVTGADSDTPFTTTALTVCDEAQLDAAISTVNAAAAGDYKITFGGVIGEISTPLAFNLPSDVTATLDGGGYTLDGNAVWGGLSVTSGDVTIKNLTVVNMNKIAVVPTDGKLINVGFWNDNAVVNSGANSTFSVAGSNNSIVMLGSGGAITLSGTSLGSDTVKGLNGATGTVFLSSAQTSVDGGGDTINFASDSGNVASLWNTNGNWDAVNGSNGTIALNNAISGVIGGGDTIVFAGGAGNAAALYNTNGTWDGVSGSNGVVELNSALASVIGDSDTVYFAGGTGNVAALYNTNGTWDNVIGSNGVIELTSALAAVYGGSDTVYFAGGTGNAAALYDTNGAWDNVVGSNGVVELNSALATVSGEGDFVYFAGGTGNAVGLYNTNGTWDGVSGSNGVVELNSALTAVYGGSDFVYFAGGTGNAVALYNTNGTWDGVAGSNGVVELTSALASVYGGGDTVYFAGGTGNAAALYDTNGAWDNVVGSNGVVELNSALAAVYGDGDTIYFNGGQNVASASGNQETFVFQTPIGQSTITGFGATDTMQLNKSDFADWNALLSHTVQSGANTVISLDAIDAITLTGVTAANLTSSQFRFV